MAMLERIEVTDAGPITSVRDLEPGTRYVPPRRLTVDEFYELIDEKTRAELDEGAIVVPSPVSVEHEDCFLFLGTLLRLYVSERKLGRVLGSRFMTRLGPRIAREPDIMFVSRENEARIGKLDVDGGPDLVVEIINSSKGRSEAHKKVPQYERAGVRELWLIDLPERRVRFLSAVDGLFNEALLKVPEELCSGVVEGFHLPVGVLFSPAGQFPAELPILQALLQPSTDAE